jgi:hypothetical protein
MEAKKKKNQEISPVISKELFELWKYYVHHYDGSNSSFAIKGKFKH